MKNVAERINHITMTFHGKISRKIHGTENEFKVDTGSAVTFIPLGRETMKNTKTLETKKKYQDVNKNEMKVFGKMTIEAAMSEFRRNLNIFITKRQDKKPFFGTDWLRKIKKLTRNIENTTNTANRSQKDQIITIFETSLERTEK